MGEAHTWLRAFDDIKLHRSLRARIQQMYDALQTGNYPKANSLIEAMQDLGKKLQSNSALATNEYSVMLAECAFVAYKMGYSSDALRLLRTSLELCNRTDGGHFEATARWMLGCLQVESDMNDAIASWESSISTYQRLMYGSANYLSNATYEWYRKQIAFMNSALDHALGYTPAGTAPQSSGFANFQTTPGFGAAQEEPSFFSEQDLLRLFTIYNEVQAGDFSSTNGDGNSLGYMEVDRVRIKGLPYRIVNLRGSGRVIRYAQDQAYEVISVNGDSMDALGIDPGDYVLLRLQKTAQNNDIVAAMIHDFDDTATLKKFLMRENRIILKFCSRNPIFKEPDGRDKQFIFAANDARFHIRGVAVAMFKPI